jgi:hypothetical protein
MLVADSGAWGAGQKDGLLVDDDGCGEPDSPQGESDGDDARWDQQSG